jgi:hypothetical protein
MSESPEVVLNTSMQGIKYSVDNLHSLILFNYSESTFNGIS